MHRRSPRVPGPFLVMAFLALVVAAAAGAWNALGQRPRAAGAVDLAAIDGEYAVLIRDVAGDPGRSFLCLMHPERGEVWGALIPAYTPRPGPGSGLATTAGVISVRVPTGGVPYVRVFEAARGVKLGRYALVPAERAGKLSRPPEAAGRPGSVAGEGQSFELLELGETTSVVALDLAEGVPLWRDALEEPAPVGPVWLRDSHLLVYQPGRLHILDRRTGQPAAVHAGGVDLEAWPCVLADRVYGVDQGAVRAMSISDARTRSADAVAAAALAGPCGSYGDRDVLAVVDAQGHAALVAVDPASLAPRWRISLDAPLLVPEPLYLGAPDAVSLAGRLPRFVPLLAGEARAPRLIIADVKAGSIAHRGAPAPRLAGARLMREGGRFYLWAPRGSAGAATLATLDGATGALDAAITLGEAAAPVWPRHIAGGRIWIHGSAAAGTAAWAVLDGARLGVIASGRGDRPANTATLRVTETRDALARELGLP